MTRPSVGMHRQGFDLQTDPVRRPRLTGDVLHDPDGALADERDWDGVGAQAVAGLQSLAR